MGIPAFLFIVIRTDCVTLLNLFFLHCMVMFLNLCKWVLLKWNTIIYCTNTYSFSIPFVLQNLHFLCCLPILRSFYTNASPSASFYLSSFTTASFPYNVSITKHASFPYMSPSQNMLAFQVYLYIPAFSFPSLPLYPSFHFFPNTHYTLFSITTCLLAWFYLSCLIWFPNSFLYIKKYSQLSKPFSITKHVCFPKCLLPIKQTNV